MSTLLYILISSSSFNLIQSLPLMPKQVLEIGDIIPNLARNSFLAEYLGTLGGSTEAPIAPLVVPSKAPTEQKPLKDKSTSEVDAIEDAILAALETAKEAVKTTTSQPKTVKPKRRKTTTSRSSNEMKDSSGGSPTESSIQVASGSGAAIFNQNNFSPIGVASSSLATAPGSLEQGQAGWAPAPGDSYILMTPEQLSALQNYQNQQHQLKNGVGLSPGGGLLSGSNPGEYIAGFFGSLGSGNFLGMADNAIKLLATSPVQGFIVSLADQVTCQLGNTCKKSKDGKIDINDHHNNLIEI